MAAFHITGALHRIGETKQVSAKFSKREFVLEVEDGRYPQMIAFELTGDRCQEIDHLAVGEEVRVTFDIRGREWKSPQGETKYFNSLNAWKVEGVGDALSADRARDRDRRENHGRSTDSSSNTGRRDDAPPPATDDDLPF